VVLQPLFWGTALVLIAFIQLKTFLPKPLSLPLDVADTWEDKISALLVSGTLVPDLVGQVATNFATPAQMAHIMESPFSSGGYITLAAMTFDYRLLFLPLGIAAFFVVWMTSHAINLLILLCPFSIVDLGLKIFKAALIGAVIVSYLIHPILGVIVSLSFIAMATYLAPKVFRFSFFVTLLSFDLMTPWRGKKASKPDNAHAFISHKSLGAPKHTYGRIKKTTDGSVTFTYRPRLILKTQTIILPDKTLVMRKGLLYPDMLQASDDTTKFKSVIIFPPRYRKSEHLVAEQLEINDVRDHSIAKGIAGIKAWFRDFFSRGKPDQEAAVMIER